MATIYNSDLSHELRDGAKISSRDEIPQELGKTVVPVMEVNPKLLRVCNWWRGAIGAASTITTTPTDRDTYIVAAHLGIYKLAADTGTDVQLRCIVDGLSHNLLVIPGITLNANTTCLSISFPIPIKVDRGSVISTIGANVSRISGGVEGFQVENINA